MSLETLKSSIVEAIAGSTTIKVWANINYGKDHHVFDGIDSRNTPGEDSCPYVALLGYGESVSQRRANREYWFGWAGFVYDDSLSTTVYSNLIRNAGVVNVEALRKHVENTIKGCLTNEELEVDVDVDVNDDYPFHRFEMITTIVAPVTIGSDPLS